MSNLETTLNNSYKQETQLKPCQYDAVPQTPFSPFASRMNFPRALWI